MSPQRVEHGQRVLPTRESENQLDAERPLQALSALLGQMNDGSAARA